uniref:TMEM219 domain-containing protein n=1 Tax=Macrostomum lignano TaxID=282301 RepID=A0A1I8IIG2_9PLAT
FEKETQPKADWTVNTEPVSLAKQRPVKRLCPNMPLLWALATGTLLIFFCTHLQVFGSGSLRVFLTTPHQNCTWLPVESSLVTFELAQNSSSAGPQPDAAACSVLLTPDPQFGQRAENFVFRIVNRHLVCRLSIQSTH